MDIKLQIISLIVSYIYGIFYYATSLINKQITDSKNNIIKFIVTIIFVINHVFLYLIILYKINLGQYHIYFLFILICGFISSHYICKNIVKKNKKTWLTSYFSIL